MTQALLFKTDIDRGGEWEGHLARLLPDLEIRTWPNKGDPKDIVYAAVWQPPKGELAHYPNLKAIFSLGAGIDHLSSDPDLPKNIPVVRMVEPGLTQGMVEYVVMTALYLHRFMPAYDEARRRHDWIEVGQIATKDRRIGILGLGVLGSACAEGLLKMGFTLSGWSRSEKAMPQVRCHHGAAGLEALLGESKILVSLLPRTPETEGLLNRASLEKLPKGAAVINVGRGATLVEDDLLALIEEQHLSGAALDVFQQEPLPKESPIWDHPRIFMTPHCASMTIPETAAQALAQQIKRHQAGAPLDHVVDFLRGY